MTRRTTVADYELTADLGPGSYGRLYRARSPERLGQDRHHVILKVLERDASDTEFDRLANEVRVLASVRSEHVVTVLDAGFDRGRLFYAMVDHGGGTLASHGSQHSTSQRIRFVADAALGAHELHEHGAAHRDIRPGTIAIDGRRGRLFDVGLAQLLTPGLTTTGRGPVGTIEFLDPEVALGAKASRSSDVWSLGVTLHFAVSGRGVHPGLSTRNLGAALRHLVQAPPMLDPELPDDVADVVGTCLAPSPSQRFATAADVAESIESILLVKGRP